MSAGIQGGQLYIGEDLLVEWGNPAVGGSGLYDNNIGSFVNDATVTWAWKDSANSAVSGGTGTASYIAGSQGCYRGVSEDGVSFTSGSTYYLEVTATGSGDRIGFRRIQYIAKHHGSI